LLELLDTHGARLHGLLFKLTLREDVAEDLMQDLAIKLASSDGFAKARSPLGYALIAAATLAYTWRRKRRAMTDSQAMANLAAPQAGAIDQLLRTERQQRLLDAVAALPETMRETVTLRYLEQWSHARIADHLGQSPASVRMACHRAVRHLREMLQAHEGTVDHARP
jgi:RNA polymerase sigma-70 factor (ECF subfamily)